MKWPSRLTIVRHGQSTYNALRQAKQDDPGYRSFVREFEHNPQSVHTLNLKNYVRAKYPVKVSDYDTPLSSEGHKQAKDIGRHILKYIGTPDVIFVSPYLRTRQTFEGMCDAAQLDRGDIRVVYDDRIREQEHGLSLLYSDWRVFQVEHPEQKALRDLQGPYWYQYPQGESVSMVRERIRSFLTMLVREYSGTNVLLVSHHLTKLSIRANLERLSPEEFMRIDEEEKPINCGVTTYNGRPALGKNGRLELEHYNLKLY